MAAILSSFELPLPLFHEDVRAIAASAIERHGSEEWRLAVLAGELHGHLGIYSTLGVKMGLRAREILAGKGLHGEISVLSFAGSAPPVSCLNDGLQVSTGATVGHGLIAVSDEPLKRVEALFRCLGSHPQDTQQPTAPRQSSSSLSPQQPVVETGLRLALRPEYEECIRGDIADAVSCFGHSPAYWDHIRALALRYWADWDRRTIFAEV